MAAQIQHTRAIFFDLMGTCLDWHSAIVDALPPQLAKLQRSHLAIAWRESFFEDIHSRFEQKLPPEDIDTTHRRLLECLTITDTLVAPVLDEKSKTKAVDAWHSMQAWPDVARNLARLREKHRVFVLANGSTRLQLDLMRSSGLEFDLLFSSQLLGVSKPDPEIYQRAMQLVGVTPEQSIMVAAHAYDLRAAKAVGMHTVYLRRWTEDTQEDMEQIRRDVDVFIGDLNGRDGNLAQLAQLLA
ncbi:(S)-2-haloacid dehalogenase IVA [Thozetella sp. PMI_491]|nr:(S)-2-haloacid dehalogenase IVA [Thozetella sp. PMI_491]